jgi:Pyruvate/2-oxoacid:ferredoxin oxidoreductase delta subunit
MTLRTIVQIDEERCNGCGACVPGCAEGALQIIDGKARLVADVYCDGLGACLGECPQGAITMVEREAPEFDEQAALAHVAESPAAAPGQGCPGMALQDTSDATPPVDLDPDAQPSALTQWPVQLMLVPPTAPFLRDADLLIAADCVPFALANFHGRFLQGGKKLLIACPKLDDAALYVEKLTVMFQSAGIRSVTILRMEVPCCGGLSAIVQRALAASGQDIPVEEVVVGIKGDVLN